MGCGNNTSLLEEELGILPRAIRQLYEAIEERSNQAEFLVSFNKLFSASVTFYDISICVPNYLILSTQQITQALNDQLLLLYPIDE